MHFDHPLDDGKADAESTGSAVERAIALNEQVEYSGQQRGRDADAGVSNTQHRITLFPLH